MKKPDLLILIAIWEFISAFGALIGILAIAVFAFPSVIDQPGDVGGIFGLSIGMFALVCYFAVAIAGGVGLLLGKEWGRIVSLVYSALNLFAIPFGTALGILAIIYLLRPNVREYFKPTGLP